MEPNLHVFVRYTVDNWRSYKDVSAAYTTHYSLNGHESWSCYR